MAKTLEAHDKLIREIFEGSYQFEIPDYQRPYATSFWGTQTHKGDILVYLRLDQNALLSILPSSSQLVRKVRLETEDKLRTLKILQALAFLDNEAEVVIGNSFELTTKTWQLTMHGFVDEALVMESLGVLGTHVPT